jgi:hypothetical protein
MGTNYYLRIEPCKHCGRSDEELHIGKSSAGWCFSLHVIPENNINTLYDWIEKFPTGKIFDEYGVEISIGNMLDTILNRSWHKHDENKDWSKDPFYNSWKDFHNQNNSEFGPNNLLRSKINGGHCIGHGEGTYDLKIGEFC